MSSEKQIRILVDAHVLDGTYQGTRTFIEEIYKELLKKKDLIIFIASNDPSKLETIFGNRENVNYISYKSTNRFTRLAREIPALIKKHNIDYAHFQYITPLTRNCHYIVTTHDLVFHDVPSEFSFPYRKLKNFLYKRSLKMASLRTTVSEHSRNAIERHYRIGKDNVHVIPNGVDESFYDAIDKELAAEYIYDRYGIERFILCVSRIEPRKNHLLLLKIFSRLQLASKGYHLVFLGSKSIKVPGLNKALRSLTGLEKQNVMMKDDVDREELKYFLAAASLFLYPSKGEGFGIPPLEAAALRVPVVCSNATAMKDFSFFNEDHVDPHDELAFEKRVTRLLKHPLPETLLEKRSQHIRENYSWKKSAEKLYRLIKDHHSENQSS